MPIRLEVESLYNRSTNASVTRGHGREAYLVSKAALARFTSTRRTQEPFAEHWTFPLTRDMLQPELVRENVKNFDL